MKFIIMAGGQGIRLWPLSRTATPKQFQKLVSSQTLLQETAARIVPGRSWDDVFVSANQNYVEIIKVQLPELPVRNLIAEPSFRERMAALALTLAHIDGEDDPIITIMPSDHYVKDKDALTKVIDAAEQFLLTHPEHLVVVAAKPQYPEIAYGYIKTDGISLGEQAGEDFLQVAGFMEKPHLQEATQFLAEANFFWNCGIYIFKRSALLSRIQRMAPEVYEHYLKIKEAIGTEAEESVVQKEYVLMDMISMEKEILEKDSQLALVVADIGWSDVGTWALLKDALAETPSANISVGDHWDADSTNTLVYGDSGRLVATIGLKDLIIVDTPDALLVCDKKRSAEVKKVVDNLRGTNHKKLL